MDTVINTIRASKGSFMSGLKNWMMYCDFMQVPHMPANRDHARRWLSLFKHAGTARNYLAYVKKAHQIVGHSCTEFDVPETRQVIAGIEKGMTHVTKPRRRVQSGLLRKMVHLAAQKGWTALADLWILSYAFLLRVPSEALAMQAGNSAANKHSRFFIKDGVVTLHLNKRKNAPKGQTLQRSCCCVSNPALCPHLVCERRADPLIPGQRLFGITYAQFLKQTREILRLLKVENFSEFGSHVFRRGCCDDMRAKKSPLRDILEAGGWKSGAFALYLEREAAERDAVATVLIDVSSDEETDVFLKQNAVKTFNKVKAKAKPKAKPMMSRPKVSVSKPNTFLR